MSGKRSKLVRYGFEIRNQQFTILDRDKPEYKKAYRRFKKDLKK